MRKEIKKKLIELIAGLDAAIIQAVENPLLFADTPLQTLESNCADLIGFAESSYEEAGKLSREFTASERAEHEALLWQVRAKAGRLQMLLDTAAHFYSNCFSFSQPQGLAYSVHGEWSSQAAPSHLAMDC